MRGLRASKIRLPRTKFRTSMFTYIGSDLKVGGQRVSIAWIAIYVLILAFMPALLPWGLPNRPFLSRRFHVAV